MMAKTWKTLLASTLMSSAVMVGAVQAQTEYPNKPISLIVPFSPGGITDILGRAIAEGMGQHLKQTVVVENKPGVAGSMGANDMVGAKPDGYSLSLAPAGIFRQPYLQKTRYDPIKDLTYIATYMDYDFVLAVKDDSPFKTLEDLVNFAKQNPGKLDFSSAGRYTGNQLMMVALAKEAGLDVVHVPFRGDTEAITALLGNQVQAVVSSSTIIPFLKDGKVRALATAAPERPAAFADVPTLVELGYDVTVPSPLGVAGPKDLPPEIVLRLEAAVKAAMEGERFQRLIGDYGIRTNFMDHKAYAEFAEQAFKHEKEVVEMLGKD